MDKKEETPESNFSKEDIAPFPKRDKVVDKVKIAKLLIPTYEERLAEYLKKYDKEMDEIDFLKNELKISKTILDPKNHYTVGVKWEIYQKNYNLYVDFLDNKIKSFIDTEQQGKVKSNVNERLYALKELCPELIDSLSKLSKKEKIEIMQIITNSNGDNILKKLIYKTLPMDVDSEFEDKIQRFKVKMLKKKA